MKQIPWGISFLCLAVGTPWLGGTVLYESNFQPNRLPGTLMGVSSTAAVLRTDEMLTTYTYGMFHPTASEFEINTILDARKVFESDDPGAVQLLVEGGFQEGEIYRGIYCVAPMANVQLEAKAFGGGSEELEIIQPATLSAVAAWCGDVYEFMFRADESGRVSVQFSSPGDPTAGQALTFARIEDLRTEGFPGPDGGGPFEPIPEPGYGLVLGVALVLLSWIGRTRGLRRSRNELSPIAFSR